ncbi:MFS transporter [Humibacter sp. RRB41]|uniref:MFS transporter n=1 Tax=Humibacter sp. RRB41 TaxID=2919946 RepID=UPI001FAA1C2E|nr:MFS transporter [Humibacter sp. RRB41]
MYDTLRSATPRPTSLGARTPRAERAAVFALFATAGLLIGIWAATIPAVSHRANVSPAELGVLILISSIGIVVGAQLGGRLQARHGSIGLCLGGLVTAAFGAAMMGQSGDAGVLCVAMTIFSFGMGLNDVGMNLQAVLVERAYRRPIMAAFHAFFSLGGVVGALLVLALASAGWDDRTQLLLTAVVVAASVSVACRWLVRTPLPLAPGGALSAGGGREGRTSDASQRVPTGPAGWPDDEYAVSVSEREPQPRRVRVRMTRVAWMLGLSALVLMFTEGVATDWSGLQLTQAFGAAAGVSAFGYAAFCVTMTGGRLLVDRVVAVVGPVVVVRVGSVVAAVGLATVVFSPSIWVTLAGWAILGVGLCGCVPQIFSAAGNQPGSGVVLSRVITLGYVGIFGGPAVIGWLAGATNVTVALVMPFVLLAVPAVLASAVRRPGSETAGLRPSARPRRRPAPRGA